jgi:hypothetical protein
MESLLVPDMESAEHALHALAADAVRSGARSSMAATPFLVALLDRAERPGAPDQFLRMLARIAVGDPDAVACGSGPVQDGALEATESTLEEAERERDARIGCERVVSAGTSIYVRWLGSSNPAARTAAAHLLAFVARDDRSVDQALAQRARDNGEQPSVRASALLALGVRGAAHAADLPPPRAQELGEATILEAAAAFAALGSREAALVKTAERSAVDVLARGVAAPPAPATENDSAWPWPRAERLLLSKLALHKGRSARAQTAFLRLLPLARDRSRAERMASHLLVLAFGEPTAAAFSDWKPSLEVFPGASAWSAEQRTVLRAIASLDALWPASAELGPRVRHVDACGVQIALKRMLELAYYPSRQGLRAAIALVFNAGAGAVRR